MSFPKRITSNLKRSLSINSPKEKTRRLQQLGNGSNHNGKLNRQRSTDSSVTTPTSSNTKTEKEFIFKFISGTVETNLKTTQSDKDLSTKDKTGAREKPRMSAPENNGEDYVDTTRQLISTGRVRTRDRRRKRSNTIDVGALLEFRSTVSSFLRSLLFFSFVHSFHFKLYQLCISLDFCGIMTLFGASFSAGSEGF